ncbi:MAG: tRNA (N6-threonylcarbamoyladenosine(37)-N6)-methyltransferase TrmO [Deltaproteobacteria bacterium]|nr:tRNA (N6-threonylcarbamoyladenosine(37)-N6)-methyltransferase TrmO [Deltaproteobacteria bacterium]
MTLETYPDKIVLMPVGYIRSRITKLAFSPDGDIDPEERKRKVRSRHQQVKQSISELEIDPDYEDLLDGIDAFSHILVLYWPHLLPEKERGLKKVHPMGRKDIPEQGIFATRSPARPNPVLVSSVQLLERNKNVLRVQGLEALDGSPILDIKPVVREKDGIENPRFPDWIKEIHKDLE